MLLGISLYDLFILAFIQLIVSTLLVVSPARELGNRYRWTGSRITEVVLSTIGAAAIAAVSVVLTHTLVGLTIRSLEPAAFLLLGASIVVIVLQPDRSMIGQAFYASFASASMGAIAWAAYLAVVTPDSIPEAITASLVVFFDIGALLVWMSNINYTSDVLSRSRRGRPLPAADPTYQPMVSLHIPAHNEPPELLIRTIQAVERIDYPNFEIIVIDNNTQDPKVWGPVEEYCRDRPRIKFVHVSPWPGYKAGACNLALREYTDPRAEIIGLIDADDLVEPYYLRETAAYFSDPTLGFLQTFEGNRDFEDSAYYTACVDSYQAFYLTNMSSRNERDAVPFVGTMGLFRKSALMDVGGWNEWCICEDTEASLRVAKDGWSGLYVPRCFGRGIVPPSFTGMLTQRHRWCFGAMQILRLHWRSLMPWDRSPDNHLTAAQRRDYLMASFSWFRDLMMVGFSLLLIAICVSLALQAQFTVVPMDGSHSLLPLSFIVTAIVAMMVALRHWTSLSHRRVLLSLVISLAVAFVIARGCIEGVLRRDGVFLRTPKTGGRRTLLGTLSLTRWETALGAALLGCAGVLAGVRHGPWLLIFLVIVQGAVYLCSPFAAIWNLRVLRRASKPRERSVAAKQTRPRLLVPRHAAAIFCALCFAGIVGAFVAPPVPLLQAATVANEGPWPQSLLASAGTTVYLKLGPSGTAVGSAYYPIVLTNLSGLKPGSPAGGAGVGLNFTTKSVALLDQILRAATHDGNLSAVSVAFRTPTQQGGPAVKLVDTFPGAAVTYISEPTAKVRSGRVSLLLPAATSVTSRPEALEHAGPFVHPTPAAVTQASVTLGPSSPSYALTSVNLSRAAAYAPLQLSFGSAAAPLLQRIFQAQDASSAFPTLTLSVRHGPTGRLIRQTFVHATVNAFTENLSGQFSGTASLIVESR